MKYDKTFLMDLIKFYAIVALVPTVLLAPYFEPKYWIGVYPVVLVGLLGVSWVVNSLLERLGWPKAKAPRTRLRKAAVRKKRK
jgi:hypothetical protein